MAQSVVNISVLTDTTVTTTTETVLLTFGGMTVSGPDSRIAIFGLVSMTHGTGATAVTMRVRRGTTITGTLVGEANALSVTAGNSSEQNFGVLDSPGEVAGQQYVLTAQFTAATGNSTITSAMGTAVVNA